MRQHAPNNHVLDLVVVCMLSPLCMLLLCVALSLLGCIWPHIHLRLLYTTQTRATLGTVISRDCDPGLRHESLISHEPGGSKTRPQAIHLCLPMWTSCMNFRWDKIAVHTVPLFHWAALGLMTFPVPTVNIRSCHFLSKVLIRLLLWPKPMSTWPLALALGWTWNPYVWMWRVLELRSWTEPHFWVDWGANAGAHGGWSEGQGEWRKWCGDSETFLLEVGPRCFQGAVSM